LARLLLRLIVQQSEDWRTRNHLDIKAHWKRCVIFTHNA